MKNVEAFVDYLIKVCLIWKLTNATIETNFVGLKWVIGGLAKRWVGLCKALLLGLLYQEMCFQTDSPKSLPVRIKSYLTAVQKMVLN